MEDGAVEAENMLHPREIEEEEQEEEKGGGVLNSFVSNLMGSRTAENQKEEPPALKGSGETAGGGGLISNLISAALQIGGGDENRIKVEGNVEDEDGDKEENVGGIINKIVCLPEDAIPTTDEASILIHSVVRD